MVASTGQRSMGEKLAEIVRLGDAAGAAWREAGYPLEGAEWEAREEVFAALARWNAEMKEQG